jgi:integrase/recombinase XerD
MKPLREAIQDYLSLRRSLGFKLHDAGAALAHFASFMEQHGAIHVTTQLALAWAQESHSAQPANWAQRLSYVRGFARHHSAVDAQTEVPPAGLLPFRPARARPYIYSEEEIERLLESALRLLPDAGLLSLTYYCLFGLLSVAGLRLGEAIRLELDDVDLGEGLLTVRGTKFGKSRLVPIHASTQAALARYRRRRERLLTGHAATFFINSKGHRLDRGEIHRTFYKLSRHIGLRGATASHGPRIHDLRHRFAVQTLLHWYQEGADVERRLPVLSTYLGHVHINDTYWYLSACPQLMGLAVERLERRWEAGP